MRELQGPVQRGHEAASRPPRGTVGQSSGKAENQVVKQRIQSRGAQRRKERKRENTARRKDFPQDRHAGSRTK